MDAAGVISLLARKGEPAVLRRVTSTRAATGGTVTRATTDLPVSLVRTLQQLTTGDGAPVRRIEALLGGVEPHVGDTLVLAGTPYEITQVGTIIRAGVAVVFEVVFR